MPFTSILYANGPGYVHINGTRENITLVDYCKYRLISFSCGTCLCWCVHRHLEAMRLWLACACFSREQRSIMMVILFTDSWFCLLFSSLHRSPVLWKVNSNVPCPTLCVFCHWTSVCNLRWKKCLLFLIYLFWEPVYTQPTWHLSPASQHLLM